MARRLIALAVALSFLLCPSVALSTQAPRVFKKVDFFGQEGDEMKDKDAQLILDARRRLLIFADEDKSNEVFATVSWDRITTISYENSKHARISAGLLIAWPLLFLKGKKHWLTVTYGPGGNGDPSGYVFARMDKGNFQAILAAINGYTGREIRRIEENGEISVLYPGVVAQPQPVAAPPAGQPAPARPMTQPAAPPRSQPSTVPASALPPADPGTIAAAPLPPAADTPQPLVILNKGVRWTSRSAGTVGFAWSAEVQNPNSTNVNSSVFVRLHDASGNVIHEAAHDVSVPARGTFSFTDNGQVPEAQAVLAAHWSFDVAAIDAPTEATPAASPTGSQPPAPTPSSAPGSAGANAPGGNSAPQPAVVPVPLTPDMMPPQLITRSISSILEDPLLRQLDIASRTVTIRCLVRDDGTVADAKVFRVAPQPFDVKARDQLSERIRQNAIDHWKFTPAMKQGTPLPVWHMVTVNFQRD